MSPSARLVAVLLLVASTLAAPSALAARAPRNRPPAALRLVGKGVYPMGSKTIALQGQRLQIKGIVRQYVPGQVVDVRVSLGRHRLATVRRVVQPYGAGGQFVGKLPARRLGRIFAR